MDHSEATFRFTLPNFSKLTDWALSPSFLVRDLPWMIKVKRNQTSPDFLSYFIQCQKGTTSSTWSCRASLEFCIKSFKNKDFVRKTSHLFTASEHDWGYPQYDKSWIDLINPENGFIVDDKVTFEVKITADSPVGASTGQVITRVFIIYHRLEGVMISQILY